MNEILVRSTRREDVPGIIALSRTVYPGSPPWAESQLRSHLDRFPEGQLVAVDAVTGRVVGMAASLIIRWDDYDVRANWREFTSAGTFENHDPAGGRTLYGAEIMVDPALQRRRIGHQLYEGRREIARTHRLLRIRAGARLRRYGHHHPRLSAQEYVLAVIRGELQDPTLSFQLREGFRVFGVVEGYLAYDPESMGFAALIEWLNHEVATPADSARRNPMWDVPADRRP